MRVSDEFISLLRQKIDIADVVSDYVKLKHVGRSLVGLCPFHSERSPSFHVSPEKGFYHCFGCGAGGTVFTFLMDIEQLSFLQAIEKLAIRAGVPVPQVMGDSQDDERSRHRTELLRALDLATKFYNHILMNHDAGAQGLSYLVDRHLTKKSIAEFHLGFAPKGGRVLVDFLSRRSVSPTVMIDAGLCMVTDQGELRDRFRGRVMFPIADTQGRTVGFGARTLTSELPKYLNSPETVLFHKGNNLYGFHRARQGIRQKGQAILLEGYMDVIALHQAGVTNALATLGTALTPVQAGILHRVAQEVILVYDGDAAGQQAAAKNIDVLRDLDLQVRIARLPDGMDPDEWILSHGEKAFHMHIIDEAQSALPFRLTKLTHEHPNHLTSGKTGYLKDAIDIIADEPSSIEREASIEWLSQTYAVSLGALRDDLQFKIRAKEKQRSMDKNGNRRNTDSQVHLLDPLPLAPQSLPVSHEVAARQLLMYMLIDSDVLRQVQEDYPAEFSLPMHSALQAYLYMFYEHHAKTDPELFLSSIDDSQVLQFAVSLLHEASEKMEPGHPIDVVLVRDYIQCLIGHRLEQQIEGVTKKMKEATALGDFNALGQYEQEFRRLQRALSERSANVQV